MELFQSVFNQIVYLFVFILVGFILAKFKFLPDNASTVLSKLENMIFLPCMILNTLIFQCNVEELSKVWKLLVCCCAIMAIVIPLSVWTTKCIYRKNRYVRNIATYGLVFSNFGFMGLAVVGTIFPEALFEYTMFTLPLWFGIYLWGAPVLLIANSSDNGRKPTARERAKAFVNPMVFSIIIGVILGLTGWGKQLPAGVLKAIDVSADCMSPIAMILTGFAIGKSDFWKLISGWRVYALCAVKTIVFPLLFVGVFALLPHNSFFTETFFVCATCFAAMPMGLNGIVIPVAYGKDTSDAAGMALISHIFAIVTIPLIFMLLQTVVL